MRRSLLEVETVEHGEASPMTLRHWGGSDTWMLKDEAAMVGTERKMGGDAA
jgi:hypothetical protein